jgi:hypothetical protein
MKRAFHRSPTGRAGLLASVLCMSSLIATPIALADDDDTSDEPMAEDARLPSSWYALPEDQRDSPAFGLAPEALPAVDAAASEMQTVTRSLDHVLGMHSEVLDEVAESDAVAERDAAIANLEQDGKKAWRLSHIALDLGLSAQGTIGLLLAKGEALVNVYWRHLGAPNNRDADERTPWPDDGASLAFSAPLTHDEVVARVEPLIRSVMATGAVRDEARLRAELTAQAQQFNDMLFGIMDDHGAAWALNRLRLDFTIAASGMVQPGLTIGGGLRIRFDWFRPAVAPASLAMLERSGTPIGDRAGRFIAQLAAELQQVNFDAAQQPASLRLNQVVFSLGMWGNGNFGVAKGSLSLIGYAYFARQALAEPQPYRLDDAALLEGGIPLIDDAPTADHVAYADRHHIAHEPAPALAGDRERNGGIFRVPTRGLQLGLEKTAEMGSYLADRADQQQPQHWAVDQLRAQFALSLGGTAGIVTIAGTAGVQLIFNNPAPAAKI